MVWTNILLLFSDFLGILLDINSLNSGWEIAKDLLRDLRSVSLIGI